LGRDFSAPYQTAPEAHPASKRKAAASWR